MLRPDTNDTEVVFLGIKQPTTKGLLKSMVRRAYRRHPKKRTIEVVLKCHTLVVVTRYGSNRPRVPLWKFDLVSRRGSWVICNTETRISHKNAISSLEKQLELSVLV